MHWRESIYLMSFYPLEEIRKKAYQLFLFIFVLLVLGGGFAFHVAHAAQTENGISGNYLSPHVRDTLSNHPLLRQSGARSCRAIFVLGQRRAEKRVDVSASVSGERELVSNFQNNNDRLPSRLRGYNTGNDNVFDLDIEARYRLYDWGVGDALVRSEESRLHAERLNYEVNLFAVIEDSLRVMMQLINAREEVSYRKEALEAIAPHVEAIEAQGRAVKVWKKRLRL